MLCDIHINLRALQYQSTAGRVKDRLLALTFIFLPLLLCVMDKGDLQGRTEKKKTHQPTTILLVAHLLHLVVQNVLKGCLFSSWLPLLFLCGLFLLPLFI